MYVPVEYQYLQIISRVVLVDPALLIILIKHDTMSAHFLKNTVDKNFRIHTKDRLSLPS